MSKISRFPVLGTGMCKYYQYNTYQGSKRNGLGQESQKGESGCSCFRLLVLLPILILFHVILTATQPETSFPNEVTDCCQVMKYPLTGCEQRGCISFSIKATCFPFFFHCPKMCTKTLVAILSARANIQSGRIGTTWSLSRVVLSLTWLTHSISSDFYTEGK